MTRLSQLTSKRPARLADGLEVEGPPPAYAGLAPGNALTFPSDPPLHASGAWIRQPHEHTPLFACRQTESGGFIIYPVDLSRLIVGGTREEVQDSPRSVRRVRRACERHVL